jgi:outer membrane receptor protein involved in Fe transport
VKNRDGQNNGAPLADTTAHAFSPKLSVLYDISPAVAATASAYRAFRAPTLNELYRTFRLGDTLTLANSALTPERVNGIETGLLFRRTGPFEGRLTLYQMELSDPVANVTLTTTPALITRQRRNLGEARTRGLELDLEAALVPELALTAGWLFADAVVTDAPNDPILVGKRVPLVPRHQLSLGARWQAPFRLLASGQVRYQTSVFEDDRNTATLGSALVLDARLAFEAVRGLSLFVAGENLLDRRIETARAPVLTLAPGASVRAGARLFL